jgi:hypothetical protein
MKMKIKKALSCVMLGVTFAGVFMVGFSISCGVMTRLEGLAIIGVGVLLTAVCSIGIKEEK